MAPSKTLKKKKGEGRGGPPVRAQASHLPFIIPSGTGRPPFLPEKSIDRWSRWNVVPSRETTHAAASSATQRFFHCRGSPPAGHLPSRLSSSLEQNPPEVEEGWVEFSLSLDLSLEFQTLSFEREIERIYSINVSAAILFARETSRSKKSIYFRIFSSRYFCRSYRNGLDSSQIRLQDPWILIGRAARGWSASFIDTVLSPDDSAIRSHIRSKGPCISRSSPRLDSPEV